jgi:uncharacterized membrane protein YciS (DUF1049 family)
MNLVTVSSFAVGVACGYLIRKNWFIVARLLTKAPKKISDKQQLVPTKAEIADTKTITENPEIVKENPIDFADVRLF